MLKVLLATFLTLAHPVDLASSVKRVRHAAREVGIDPDYLCKVAKVESNWNRKAVNRASGARGLFQITKPTEYNLRKKYRVYGDIFNAYTNAILAGHLTQEHIMYLQKKKMEVTHRNLYLLHFFGIPAGYRFLTTKNSEVLKDRFPREYKYNSKLFGNKTVGELKQYFENKLKKAANCGEL